MEQQYKWLTLEEVQQRIAEQQKGPAPHYKTVHRWCTQGCNGVILRSMRRAGRRMVREDDLEAFFIETNATPVHGQKPRKKRVARPAGERERRAQEALQKIKAMGVRINI